MNISLNKHLLAGLFITVAFLSFAYFTSSTKGTLTNNIEGERGDLLVAAAAAPTLSDKVTITVTADGKSHDFLKSEAIDKGSFTSPAGFTQNNLCDTNPSLPHMTVCFRPDADSSRDEVVFEYGTFMQKPVNTGAYTAFFYKGSTQLASQSVSNHNFYQRWRWIPQGYRPRYRTLASLEAARLLPPYRKGVDPSSKNDTIPAPKASCLYTQIFATACITQYMGTTGERPDLGHVTGTQGNYLLSQSDAWWQAVLAQAEAGMGIPWNIRDEGGTPVNFFRTGTGVVSRLLLTTHSNVKGKAHYLDQETNATAGWSIDQSHQPALFYLPWVLTGDPYYLEGLQFANSNNTLHTNFNRKSINLANIISDQVRGNAWNMRTLFGLVATTPENVPGWLLPRSYFEKQSRENAAEFTGKYVNNPAPLQSILYSDSDGFWQHDFLTFETGWATWLGISEWKPIFEYAIRSAISRVNGTSGWERRCPTVYYLPKGVVFTSWAQAWEAERTINKRVLPADTTLLCGVQAYSSYLLGALAIATHNNVPGTESLHRWYHEAAIKTLKAQGGYTVGPKWSIAPTYMLNGTLPPLPDVTDSAPVPQPTPTPTPVPTPTPPPPSGVSSSLEILSITGDFSYVNSCGTLTVGSNCNLTIKFTPTGSGVRTGVLTLRDTYTKQVKTIALRGVGRVTESPTPAPVPPAGNAGGGVTQPAPDRLLGSSGNDEIEAVSGIHYVDGGDGYDIVKILAVPTRYSDWWKITKNSDGTWKVVESHATGYTITLTNVEEVQFKDGTKRILSQLSTTSGSPIFTHFLSRIGTFFKGEGNSASPTLVHSSEDMVRESVSVDTFPPRISDLSISNRTANSATVSWRTDEEARGSFVYGTTEDFGSELLLTTADKIHHVTLVGLTPQTTYYFKITETDLAGNTVTSKRYSFKTL